MTFHDSNGSIEKGTYIIPLDLGRKLQDEGIIKSFVKDKKTNCIKIEFNHKYEENTVIVPINESNWLKFLESVEKRLKNKGIGISDYHIRLIKNTLDENWELVTGIITDNNPISDLSDLSDQSNNDSSAENIKNEYKNDEQQSGHHHQKQESQQQQSIPLLSVLEAKRSSEGLKKVIGSIVGRSTNFKVISRSEWNCQNFDCENRGILHFHPPLLHILKNLDNTAGISPSCRRCETFGSLNVIHEYQNAKIIQLDDIDTIEEKFDRLDVIMYDDASDKIIDGEIVEIEGNLLTQKKIGRNINGSSKMANVLHSAKPIIYKNRKEIKTTQRDIDNFYRLKRICQDAYKKEIELVKKCKRCAQTITPMTFEQRITAMFAPNVYGHADKKMGILRSIVGGSKAENGTENGRRGRIHIGLIGDPGTAKTALSTESTKVNPNSRMVDATGASGKSLVGIVDKENDSLMVKYGVVVAAKNSHVVINEAGSMSHEDQWHLVGISEEGKTTLDKWGEHIPIDAPTTLILTANPVGTRWESSKMSKDKMVVIRQNLLDRIDQIYGFFDAQTEEEMEGFIEELDKITKRKPHNYNFLAKFLQYAKTIEPKLTDTAKYRLNRFWITAKLKGMAGNRSFFAIKRIAEAQAKLNLSRNVDDIIASKTMQSLQLMYNQYGITIEQIQNPRDLTVEVFYNILKENNGNIKYTVRELCRKASEKNKHVNAYLKKRWDFENNKELKTIINMVEQKENIKIVGLKPRTLVYYDTKINTATTTTTPTSSTTLSGVSDLSAKTSGEVNEKNNKKITSQQSSSWADTPDRSVRNEESVTDDDNDNVKLVNISNKEKSSPLVMTDEQYYSWFRNDNEKENVDN